MRTSDRRLHLVTHAVGDELDRELVRAARVCQSATASSLAEEQADLLDAVVGSIRISISSHQPCGKMELSLLGHLAARE